MSQACLFFLSLAVDETARLAMFFAMQEPMPDNQETPVAENTYSLTAPKNSARWEEFVAVNFHPLDEDGKNKLKE